MRLAQKGTPMGAGLIVEGMDLKAQPWVTKPLLGDKGGYTYNKRNGAASAVASTDPVLQINRLSALGVNTQDFFKQAKATGVDVAEGVLQQRSGPDVPNGKAKKDKKKDKKKEKKRKKEKKKKASKKAKKKSKKKESSSSSSSGDSSSSSSDGADAGAKKRKA